MYNRCITFPGEEPIEMGAAMRLTQEKRSELDELKGEVAPKIARATEVLHEADYGVAIDTQKLEIDDAFVIASIVADLGSVNPRRIHVRSDGTTIKVIFNHSGLNKSQAKKEAVESFTAIHKKLVHRIAKIRLYESTAP